jgi:putative ABC transport system permease protein
MNLKPNGYGPVFIKYSTCPVVDLSMSVTVAEPGCYPEGEGFSSAFCLRRRGQGMNKLIFANLLHRPLRSLISVLAVAIEVIMMLTIISIMVGQLTGQKRMNNGIGADLILRASNAMIFNGINGAVIPVKLEGILQGLPHVAVATPVNQKLSMTDGLEVLWGIEYPTYSQLSPFIFVSGGPLEKPDDVIVDDVFATTGNGHRVGETILIEKRPFRIAGIFEHGKGGRKLISIEAMGDITGTPGKASAFYLKADYQVMTMDEWYSLMTPDHIPALNTAMRVVIAIAVIIGFLVIFQSMYTSVLERTREIGILKSMGASNLTIVSVVLRETVILSIAGVIVGVAISFAAKAFLAAKFPTLYLDMNAAWVMRGAAIAFAGSVCGALYPAWMAARKDPIEALSYE